MKSCPICFDPCQEEYCALHMAHVLKLRERMRRKALEQRAHRLKEFPAIQAIVRQYEL